MLDIFGVSKELDHLTLSILNMTINLTSGLAKNPDMLFDRFMENVYLIVIDLIVHNTRLKNYLYSPNLKNKPTELLLLVTKKNALYLALIKFVVIHLIP